MFFSLACYCFLDLRVIDSNFFYQRRGLMFDVSDLIFRSNLSLIQFSRYELYIYDIYVPGVLHAISTQEILPGCSSHAKRCLLGLNKPVDRSIRLIQYIKNVWQPPALPCRLQHSTIGRTDLHRRVRDGNGCCFRTHRHQTDLSMFHSRLHENLTETQPLLSSLERR